jgi:putative nucleotidyltransferase with HDIG domain
MNKNITNEVVKRAEELSRSIAVSAGYSFLSEDLLGLDNIVYQIKDSNQDVEYIAIVGIDKQIIVHSNIKKSGETIEHEKGKLFKESQDGTVVREINGTSASIFEIYSPIVMMSKELGAVIVGINRSVLLNAQYVARRRIMGVFAIVLLVGTIGSVLLSSLLTRPIKELSTGVDELKEGRRSRPLSIYSQDELGRLTKSFNEMTTLITKQREQLSEFARNLEDAYVSTVKVLAAAIDAKDPYTHGHSARISHLSIQLAGRLGLSKEEVEELEVTCLFHDVGKMRIPDSILRKTGKLNASEKREIMLHTEYGAEILSKAPSLHKFIPAVKHHHEWYNGEGYPEGLCGEEIPLFAAIISIADAFDAMTSNRPYCKALSEKEALKRLINSSGRQFDPWLVKLFVDMIENQNVLLSKKSKVGIG